MSQHAASTAFCELVDRYSCEFPILVIAGFATCRSPLPWNGDPLSPFPASGNVSNYATKRLISPGNQPLCAIFLSLALYQVLTCENSVFGHVSVTFFARFWKPLSRIIAAMRSLQIITRSYIFHRYCKDDMKCFVAPVKYLHRSGRPGQWNRRRGGSSPRSKRVRTLRNAPSAQNA